jgi:signal transduction histidine kinase
MHIIAIDLRHLNALIAVGLFFLSFSLFRLFSGTDRSQSRFFFYLSLAWLVNVGYLEFIALPQFQHKELFHLFVRLANSVSFGFFFWASAWKMSEKFPRIYSWHMSLSIVAVAILPIFLAAISPAHRTLFNAPSILFGVFSIAAIAINYIIFFKTDSTYFSPLTKASLVLSMFGYSVIQLGVFLMPPLSSRFLVRWPYLDDILFGLGCAFKFTNIVGLSQFGEAAFSDYKAKVKLVNRARLSVRLADQLGHELQTPAAELRLRLDRLEATRHIAATELRTFAVPLEQITILLSVFADFQKDQRVDRKVEVLPVSCNLNIVVDAVIISLKMTLRPPCKIMKEYAHGPIVLGVPSELSQIFRNVIKNSIEAVCSPQERPRTVGVVQVTTQVSKTDSLAQVVISDNGPGIDPLVLGQIFDDGFSTKGTVGRGHGLAIAKALVEKYNGSISGDNILHNGEISGAIFTIALPLASIP